MITILAIASTSTLIAVAIVMMIRNSKRSHIKSSQKRELNEIERAEAWARADAWNDRMRCRITPRDLQKKRLSIS